MKIRYIGHSCFVLTSKEGTSIVTDPYGDVGYPMPSITADVVTVSHSHFDHCNLSSVHGRVLQECGFCSVGDIRIEAIESYHDDAHGAKRGTNLIFFIEMDRIRAAHLGDLGEPCTNERIQKLEGCQILLIPVGGVYTIDAQTAAEYVKRLKPAVVIPMHYKTDDLNIGIGCVDAFIEQCKDFCAISSVGTELEITREAFPKSGTQIIIMEREK